MPVVDVPLFDVVPWTHGYAHSWALRWMLLNDQAARDRLLNLFLPDMTPPWEVSGVTREFKVGRHRADLRVEASDGGGREAAVLVETKVNDDLNEAQVESYCATGAHVILYGPGLTGLLHSESDPLDAERWVTGRQLIDAVGEADRLPDLIRSYLAGVAAQVERMSAARLAARGGDDFARADDFSEVAADDVEAVAWVAEVAAAMRANGAEDVRARNTRHDYGIFWAGSWRQFTADSDLGVYIDIVAAHGGWEYVITVKAGGGNDDDRLRVFNAAVGHGPPGEDWSAGRRRRADTFRIWKLDASEMSAPEAAAATLRAASYLDDLARAV